MDFGLTDDQRDIQRTARELLGERATPERVREHAEARTTDEALWRELCELGWPGIADRPRSTAGRASAQIELSILCEELGRSLAPVPFLPSAMAATRDRARRLGGAARALAAGTRLGRDARRARRRAIDGVAELVIGAAEAQVLVLVEEDGSARACSSASEAEVTPLAVDRPDPLGRARARIGDGAGELAGRRLRRARPRAGRRSARSSSASATARWR